MEKIKLATIWLDGCAGCHMSFLDMDERLLTVAGSIELVYGPLMDAKEFPDDVDVTLVEGAVSSQEDLDKLLKVRAHTKVLVALGDCAVNSNVPAMRNRWRRIDITQRAYTENAAMPGPAPDQNVPPLLPRAMPLHEYVKVDVFLPGCPPHAATIFGAVAHLLAGKSGPPDVPAVFG